MTSRDVGPSLYEQRNSSVPERITLAVLVGASLTMVWWLLIGPGLEVVCGWFGRIWKPVDQIRRACLVAALSIYYVRLLFTWFVFLKRGIGWSEVFTVAPWVLCICLLLAAAAGTNSKPLAVASSFGIVLFLVGSWINSYAEYARNVWKQRTENRGRLYTHGLFRYSRHPNYLGDLISFSGLCLISGRWFTAIIPIIMLAGFVFVNIPMLDSHLHKRYGTNFDDYAQRTRRLIPFVY